MVLSVRQRTRPAVVGRYTLNWEWGAAEQSVRCVNELGRRPEPRMVDSNASRSGIPPDPEANGKDRLKFRTYTRRHGPIHGRCG